MIQVKLIQEEVLSFKKDGEIKIFKHKGSDKIANEQDVERYTIDDLVKDSSSEIKKEEEEPD